MIDYQRLDNGINYNTTKPINYGGVQLGEGKDRVIMRTIDSYNFDNIDLIKLDIEGCEELALYGALNTIKKWRPYILYEKRDDKYVTQSMKNIMSIDDDIINGNTIQYIMNILNYKWINFEPNDCNCLLIPKEKF